MEAFQGHTSNIGPQVRVPFSQRGKDQKTLRLWGGCCMMVLLKRLRDIHAYVGSQEVASLTQDSEKRWE